MISTSNVEKHDVFQYAHRGSLDVKGKGSAAGEAHGGSMRRQNLQFPSSLLKKVKKEPIVRR